MLTGGRWIPTHGWWLLTNARWVLTNLWWLLTSHWWLLTGIWWVPTVQWWLALLCASVATTEDVLIFWRKVGVATDLEPNITDSGNCFEGSGVFLWELKSGL